MKWPTMAISEMRVPGNIDQLLNGFSFDVDAFKKWLGLEFAKYDATESSRALVPSASKEKVEIKKFTEALREMIAFLEPHGLPPRTKFLFDELAREKKFNLPEANKQILEHLRQINSFAAAVEKDAANWKSRRGSPSKIIRDDLLAAIVERLCVDGLTKAIATDVAEQILVSARVTIPASGERSVRRARKKSTRGGIKGIKNFHLLSIM